MKEILSSQYNDVLGGWADQDGSGRKSAENGGSRSGGNSGNRSDGPSLLDSAVSTYHNKNITWFKVKDCFLNEKSAISNRFNTTN